MLKSILKLTCASRSAFNYANKGIPFLYSQKYFSSTYEVDRYTELRKLAKVLGTTYFKHNDEVDYTGDVRLIDSNNRLLGIYTVREARKKCQEMNLDLVMINPTITPAICKVFNYREELYKKFVKEIVNKDISLVQTKGKATKGAKTVKLGPKMTIADLKTKVQLAAELAKKNKFIKVNMIVDEANEEAGKNVIYTYKDLAKDFLRPMGELEERLVEEEDAEELLEDEDGETYNKKILVLDFESLRFTEMAQGVLTEEDIRRLVQNFIMKEAKEEAKREEHMREQTDAEYAQALRELREPGKVETKKSKQTIEEEEDTELLSRLAKSSKEYQANPADIEKEIEEIKMRYGNDRDKAFMEYLIEEQSKRLDEYKKVFILANTVINRKRKY